MPRDAEPDAAGNPAMPEGFSPEAVRDLILAGKPVPAAWVPLVTELDFRGSDLADLTPLAQLTALCRLDLGWHWSAGPTKPLPVSDVTPLTALSSLQRLYLTGTRVRDVTPLAGLVALQRLGLRGTQVPQPSQISRTFSWASCEAAAAAQILGGDHRPLLPMIRTGPPHPGPVDPARRRLPHIDPYQSVIG
jgi:hypothetical protein